MTMKAMLCGVLVLAATMGPAPARAEAGADSTAAPPRVAYSVRDAPGYKPLVDAESTSVLLGRRLHAPKVAMPFAGGAKTLDDLGRAVCQAIQLENTEALLKLCITDAEFRGILWREFPQSRPATGLAWEDGWRILYPRLHAGCSHAVRDFGGQGYTFVRFEQPDSTLAYTNFTMHSKLAMVVKSPDGAEHVWHWLRAVVGRQGRWKIYSTED